MWVDFGRNDMECSEFINQNDGCIGKNIFAVLALKLEANKFIFAPC
jgi:hypothetical protein